LTSWAAADSQSDRLGPDPSDLSPGFDPAESEPVSEFEFDQSVPEDFGLDYDLEA
jgi:hypothetical protein